MSVDAATAIEQAFADEWGRIVAGMIRRLGDWDLAEDCTQQAFAEAARRWPREGVPSRPGAWLTIVARNRALDRLRRDRMRDARLREAAFQLGEQSFEEADVTAPEADDGDDIEDDRLRLIFTCCHPALPLEGRVALTLRTLCGLTTVELANAFVVPEATMAKRLVRAKHRIAGAGIPFRVPAAHLLPERTAGVLSVLYLLFNEGYAASTGSELIRVDLCVEAIRLARLLVALMPDEPEANGLLALMLFQHSRRSARADVAGDLLTLEEQDRSRWHGDEIDEANAILDGSLSPDEVGPYRVQALIAACHANSPDALSTDWHRIEALYGRLLEVTASPFVKLSHAVAVGMAGRLDTALVLVGELSDVGELRDYHLLQATRGDLLRRLGRDGEAAEAYRAALGMARTGAERRYLTRRLAEVGGSPPEQTGASVI